jgi:hypothetical protein
MALNQYLIDTALLLNDPSNLFFSQATLTNFINKARNRVAEDAQCVRVILPSQGTITSIAVASGGAGYTSAPTVTISSPDALGVVVQATATAVITSGQVTSITVTNPATNKGYVLPPTVTLSGGGFGTAATVGTVTLTPYVTTVTNQETYPIANYNTSVQQYAPGAQNIIGIQSVSVSWGSFKPTLQNCSWTTFQARYRSYNIGQQNYPSIWSRYGRGQAAVIYLWPIPAVVSQMDLDTYCQVIPLVNDTTVEAIPEPFTGCVKYYAAYLAHLNAQRRDDAMFMRQLYVDHLIMNGVADTPSMSPSAYDGDY